MPTGSTDHLKRFAASEIPSNVEDDPSVPFSVTEALKALFIDGDANWRLNRLVNLADPVDPADAASKQYVDQGLAAHHGNVTLVTGKPAQDHGAIGDLALDTGGTFWAKESGQAAAKVYYPPATAAGYVAGSTRRISLQAVPPAQRPNRNPLRFDTIIDGSRRADSPLIQVERRAELDFGTGRSTVYITVVARLNADTTMGDLERAILAHRRAGSQEGDARQFVSVELEADRGGLDDINAATLIDIPDDATSPAWVRKWPEFSAGTLGVGGADGALDPLAAPSAEGQVLRANSAQQPAWAALVESDLPSITTAKITGFAAAVNALVTGHSAALPSGGPGWLYRAAADGDAAWATPTVSSINGLPDPAPANNGQFLGVANGVYAFVAAPSGGGGGGGAQLPAGGPGFLARAVANGAAAFRVLAKTDLPGLTTLDLTDMPDQNMLVEANEHKFLRLADGHASYELADGPVGPQGPKGDDGARGPKGDDGAQGPKGDPGQDGAAGPALPANALGWLRNDGAGALSWTTVPLSPWTATVNAAGHSLQALAELLDPQGAAHWRFVYPASDPATTAYAADQMLVTPPANTAAPQWTYRFGSESGLPRAVGVQITRPPPYPDPRNPVNITGTAVAIGKELSSWEVYIARDSSVGNAAGTLAKNKWSSMR